MRCCGLRVAGLLGALFTICASACRSTPERLPVGAPAAAEQAPAPGRPPADSAALDALASQLGQDHGIVHASWRLLNAGSEGHRRLESWLARLSAARPEDQGRILVFLTLLLLQPPSAADRLARPFVRSQDPQLRLHAAMVLASREEPDGVEALLAELRRPDADGERAAGALIAACSRSAIPGLIELLSGGGEVAKRAHEALRELCGQELPTEAAAWRTWWSREGKAFDPRASRLRRALDEPQLGRRIQLLARLPGAEAGDRLLAEVRKVEPLAAQVVALLPCLLRPEIQRQPWVRDAFYKALSAKEHGLKEMGREGLMVLTGADHGTDVAAWERHLAGGRPPASGAEGEAALERKVRALLLAYHEGETRKERQAARRYFLEHAEECIPALVRVVGDRATTRDILRQQAVTLLEDLEAVEAGERLLAVLEGILQGKGDADLMLVERLMEVLAGFQLEKARPVLAKVRQGRGYPALEKMEYSLNLPETALHALCVMKDPEARKALRVELSLGGGWSVREVELAGEVSTDEFGAWKARLAMAEGGGVPDLEFLYQAAGDPRHSRQARALGMLAHLDTPRARQVLLAAIEHSSVETRLCVVLALVRRDWKPELPYLARLAEDCVVRWTKEGQTSGLQALSRILEQTGRAALGLVVKMLGDARLRSFRFYTDVQRRLLDLAHRVATPQDTGLVGRLREALGPSAVEPDGLRELARLAAKTRDRAAIPWLREQLSQKDHLVRLESARALASLGEAQGLAVLREMLQPGFRSQYAEQKVMVAEALAELQDPAGVTHLQAVLANPHDRDRWKAIRVAARLARPELVELLGQALLDEPPRPRRLDESPSEILAGYDWHTLRPIYRKLLEKGRGDDAIYRALARHREPEFLPLLVQAGLEAVFLREDPPLLSALRAYGQAAADALVARLGDPDPEARARALYVLSRLPEVQVPEARLAAGLADPDGEVRYFACRKAAGQRYSPGLKALRSLLSERDLRIRAAACKLAGAIRAREAVPELERLRADRRPSVKEAALAALEAIRRQP